MVAVYESGVLMTETVNVICMKWGTKYGPEYVNILAAMVARHLKRPHRFVCLTDDKTGVDPKIERLPLPPCNVPHKPETEAWRKISPWRKVSLFAPQLGDLKGPTLFLDLDIIITGPLDPLFDLPGEFCIIHNWTQRDRKIGNSSVFRFTPGAYPQIFEKYNADPDAMANAFDNEQMYVSHELEDKIVWWPDAWVKSFKRHCLPRGIKRFLLPAKDIPGASIIVFHGNPNPPDAVIGRSGKWYKPIRPAPWVAGYWHV